jgi:hypothetical protein
VEYAWLAPALCVAAFFVNVLIWRQTGRSKHLLAALTSVATILGAFVVFLVVFGDALTGLAGEAAQGAGAAA